MSDERAKVQEWLRQNVAAQPLVATRYELLDGEQIPMPPPTDAHAASVMRLTKVLGDAAGDQAVVSVQNPLALSEHSKPCPDIALLAPRDDGYTEEGVSPANVLLLVEVSDTNFALTHDRGRKASYYARAGIAECWIVDLVSQQVLVHCQPASGGYRDIRNLRADAMLTVSALPGVSLSCADVLNS
jgi:Uma2 family endonuclease